MKQQASPRSGGSRDPGIFPRILVALTALGVMPYFLLKVAWIFGAQWGIEHTSELGAAVVLTGNIITAVLDVLLVAMMWALGRRAAVNIPWWLILIPSWFAAGLLLPFIFTGPVIAAMVLNGNGTTDGTLSLWVGPLVYLSFATQAVGVVLMLGWYLRRRWGRSLEAHGAHEQLPLQHGFTALLLGILGILVASLLYSSIRCFARATTLMQDQAASGDPQRSLAWLTDYSNSAFAITAVIGLLALLRQLLRGRGFTQVGARLKWWPILLLAASGAALAGSALYAVVLFGIGAGTSGQGQELWELLLLFSSGILCGVGALLVIANGQHPRAVFTSLQASSR